MIPPVRSPSYSHIMVSSLDLFTGGIVSSVWNKIVSCTLFGCGPNKSHKNGKWPKQIPQKWKVSDFAEWLNRFKTSKEKIILHRTATGNSFSSEEFCGQSAFQCAKVNMQKGKTLQLPMVELDCRPSVLDAEEHWSLITISRQGEIDAQEILGFAFGYPTKILSKKSIQSLEGRNLSF